MTIDYTKIGLGDKVVVDEPSTYGGVFEVNAEYNETEGSWGFNVYNVKQIKPPKEWTEKYPDKDVTKTTGFITPNKSGFKAFNKLFGDYKLKLKK